MKILFTNSSEIPSNHLTKKNVVPAEKLQIKRTVPNTSYRENSRVSCEKKLKKGDTGPPVLALQRHLIRCQYPLPDFGVDGKLGDETLLQVRLFESWRRLPFSPEDTVSINTRKRLQEAISYSRGIDVSRWQGLIDWQQVKRYGVSFAYAKATEGEDYTDPTFIRNWQDMKTSEIIRGAYHFFRLKRDPVKQAFHFAKTVGPLLPNDLSLCCDIEQSDGIPIKEINKRLHLFLQELERITRRKPVLYLSERIFKEYKLKNLKEYPLWAVWWKKEAKEPLLPSDWTEWTFWQTGIGEGLPGVIGKIDMDLKRL